MTDGMTEHIDNILAYWFGKLDEAGLCLEYRNPLWFTASGCQV